MAEARGREGERDREQMGRRRAKNVGARQRERETIASSVAEAEASECPWCRMRRGPCWWTRNLW